MDHELILQLKRYEQLCNVYAVDDILDMFTHDGCIVVAGIAYCGRDTLRGAHDFDRGNRSQVHFSHFTLDEADSNVVHCAFDMSDEMDRMAGIDGWHMTAEFTFVDGQIQRFLGLAPEMAEVERHQRAKRPFQEWAWRTCPNEWAKAFAFRPDKGFAGFNFELGALRTTLAHAWRDSLQQAVMAMA